MSDTEIMPVMLPAGMPAIMPAVQIEEIMNTEETPAIVIETPAAVPEVPAPIHPDGNIVNIEMTGDQFKDITGSLMAICQETVITIDGDGLSTKMVDTANVALVSLEYGKNAFPFFKVFEPVRIGLIIKPVYNLRTMIKKGSTVFFQVTKRTDPATETTKEKITYTYTVNIDGTISTFRNYDPSLIRKEPRPPTITYQAWIDMSAGAFIQGIKDGAKVADKVAFIFDSGAFSMVFEGTDQTMNKPIPVLSNKSTGPKCRSLFSLDYIKDMIKVLNKKDVITIVMGNDYPFEMIRESENTGVTFMLAPRIESN
jgi:proliferating cell nuclear antigen